MKDRCPQLHVCWTCLYSWQCHNKLWDCACNDNVCLTQMFQVFISDGGEDRMWADHNCLSVLDFWTNLLHSDQIRRVCSNTIRLSLYTLILTQREVIKARNPKLMMMKKLNVAQTKSKKHCRSEKEWMKLWHKIICQHLS